MSEKELLKKLGEETLYSAKGHFKACDLRRQLVTCTLWLCAGISVLGMFDLGAITGKVFSGGGLFGTIALLIWNEGEGKNYRSKHKEAGEKYLTLHKKTRACFFLSSCTAIEVQQLSDEISAYDQSEKPEIPGFARNWAKRAIEGKDPETDNWFK
jgi:hypothetical protein